MKAYDEVRFGKLPEGSVEHAIRECVRYYEAKKQKKRGTKHCAGRTWGMLKDRGFVEGAEFVVARESSSKGFEEFTREESLLWSFESVVLSFPEKFSKKARAQALKRLQIRDWSK